MLMFVTLTQTQHVNMAPLTQLVNKYNTYTDKSFLYLESDLSLSDVKVDLIYSKTYRIWSLSD